MAKPHSPKDRKSTVAFEEPDSTPFNRRKKPTTTKVERRHCGDGVGLARMGPKQLATWHNELRANLPVLSYNEIRRARLSYDKAMFCEMKEDNFIECADYITSLLRMNREMRDAAGPGTLLWQREKLKDSNECLEALRTGLCAAESAKRHGDVKGECATMLALAVRFMHGDDNWWWIAEQLFIKCIQAAEKYKGDGGRSEAVARYTYGHFLLQQLAQVDEAEKQLQLARRLSEGHLWTADDEASPDMQSNQTHQRRFSKIPQLPIFVETCKLLYKALLLLAQRIRPDNGEEAIRLCKQALKRAEDAEKPEGTVEALFQLGLSYQSLGDQDTAISVFQQHYDLCTTLCDHVGMCDAHMQTAQCHKFRGDIDMTLEHLEKFKRTADKKRLMDRLAEAHRLLGEYYLMQGLPEKARTHLNASFSLYFKTKTNNDLEEVRALACIAEGQCIMPMYCKLIVDSTRPNKLRRLVKWKDSHIFFWETSMHRLESASNSDESVYSDHSTRRTPTPTPAPTPTPSLRNVNASASDRSSSIMTGMEGMSLQMTSFSSYSVEESAVFDNNGLYE